MRKMLAITFLALVMSAAGGSAAAAQSLPSGSRALLEEIARRSAAVESFTCRFVQIQENPMLKEPSVSSGDMEYRNDGHVTWRYTSPKLYQIAFTPGSVVVSSQGSRRTIDLESNPQYAKMKDLLFGIIDGSGLVSPEGFSVSVSRSGDTITVDMLPERRQLKKLFAKVTVLFAADNCMAREFIMEEADGSRTSITFSNWKLN